MFPGEQQALWSRAGGTGCANSDHTCLWPPDRAVTWSCLRLMSLPTMASPTLSPDSSSQEALSAPTCSPTSDSENLSPDELELLAKLEEQNRLLEADSKSMRSMNGSRRNSGSSLVSSSSASSNLSHLEEDTWILWGRIANEWEEWRRRKEKLLKELIRKGIPHHFRAIVWQLLCSATDMPVKNQYSELLKMSSPCEKLIRRDIARTYPEHEFFKGQDSLGQEVLFNVMKAYSLVDREVGYCQGSAFIVGLLLMQMPEEEAFCVFVRLMQEYRLRELFKPSMAELGLCIYQFEYMLQEQLPDLNTHFRSQSFHTSMYASSWFLTLFLTTFPLPVATRVFDIFMYEGLEIVFRVGLALLQVNQTELMQLDMEGMSQYFQRVIPHQFDSCPDKLILKAYQVKYNPKKMKRLEKEYAAMKSKEMEEQIEIKRLRTENRLLKQRIETLEKGQVTRAQEAEENYVIKRELAVVRQQCSSAAEDLQKAQSTIRQLQEQQDNPRLTEDFVAHLETELEQSRLRETETLGALREMQDKVLDMEKVRPSRHWGGPWGRGDEGTACALGGARPGPHQGDGGWLGGPVEQALESGPLPQQPQRNPGHLPCPLIPCFLPTRVCADRKLGLSPSDPLKLWRYTHTHTHTSTHKARPPSCTRLKTSSVVAFMGFLDSPSSLYMLPQILGSRMERAGERAKTQAHQDCCPLWGHHPGGQLGTTLSHLQPCRGHQASWSLPSCFHTDWVLTQLQSSCHGSGETNLISIHEDAGSIPGLTQRVKDPALL
uniref:Ecotropic viral integration site 5 like n=1 Tax=Sus scrofa TaxID=9823 RepID=A0A8D1BSK9_PIG